MLFFLDKFIWKSSNYFIRWTIRTISDKFGPFQTSLDDFRQVWTRPYLIGDVISGIINCSKAAMPDFTEVVEQLIGVLGLEKCCHIWIFEAARPVK